MFRTSLLHALTILSLAPLTGCTSSLFHIQEPSGLYETIKSDNDLAKRFLACTRRAYGDTSSTGAGEASPAGDAGPAVVAPSTRPLEAVVADTLSLRDDEDITGLLSVVRDLADPSQPRFDVDQLAHVIRTATRWHAHLRFDEDRLAQDRSRFAQLLLAYNKAYFGDLRFNTESNPATNDIRGVVKVASEGFVDRNGNVFVFPGLSSEIRLAPGEERLFRVQVGAVDSRRVASDLVRIFLEALFDSAFRVPAESRATALRVIWRPQEPVYPKFDAEHPPITLDQFARVSRDALRAEAVVTAAVGKAVRGGGLFGTNNETVAATLETAGGVIAKKLVEHESFCYFQVTAGIRRAADGAPEMADAQPPATALH